MDEQHDLSFESLLGPLWDKLVDWGELAIRMLPNFVVAMIVLGVALLVARYASNLSGRALSRVSKNRQVNSLAQVLVRLGISLAGAFAALAVLRLDGVVTSLLAGVGVVGIALGFAFQDIAANFMSGVMMALSRPFQVGDTVETGSFLGTVERVDLRVTHLRTPTGELILIPNKDVVNSALCNFTETVHRRVDVEVGVGYDDDLDLAASVVKEALSNLEYRDTDREVQVLYTGFGGSSVDMVAHLWILSGEQRSYVQARSDAIRAIKRALDDNGLHIPFPIRTLDFGARPVGGQRLDTVLQPIFGTADAEQNVAK